MRRRVVAVSLGIVLLIAGEARANSIVPLLYLSVLPGAGGGVLTLQATVLVALLERPFFSKAGIKRRALVTSLRANFISALVGTVLACPLIGTFLTAPATLLVWLPLMLYVSCLIEYWCASSLWGPASVRLRWIVAGNVFSTAFVILLLVACALLRITFPDLEKGLGEHAWTLLYRSSTLASLAVLLGSFFLSVTRSERVGPSGTGDENGQEPSAKRTLAPTSGPAAVVASVGQAAEKLDEIT